MSPMYEQEPQFEEHFHVGDRVAVLGMEYVGEINTRYGPAKKTLITLTTRETYPARATFSVLGAGFALLAQRAERSDFPHVAEFVTVKLDEKRTVKRFAKVDVAPKAWVDGDDGPPVDLDALAPAPLANGGRAAEEDIPF